MGVGAHQLKGECEMKLTPPKAITFWFAVILGAVAFLAGLGILSMIALKVAFWLAFAAFALLALGLLVKGL